MLKLPIYLDNHSTTPVDPEVFEAMKPYFLEKFGNASSRTHSFGLEADAAVKYTRNQAAKIIGADANEIYFTSGATESINFAHFGIAQSYSFKGRKIITSQIEHSAVLDSFHYLEKKGFTAVYLPVDTNGLVNPDQLENEVSDDTILVSIMSVNNEIGSIQNLREIGRICKEKNVLFHTDASQAIGKIHFNVNDINADVVSFTAHKFYGPKGIGVTYIKNKNPKIKITPLLYGGGQENGIRPGTLNVPNIVGLGKAAEIMMKNFEEETKRIKKLRDKLAQLLLDSLEDVHINGGIEHKVPNNLNVYFEGVKSETLIMNIREIAVSAGSACASASIKPSHVLKAIGLSDEAARSSIRIGIGRFNTEAEINYAAETIIKKVKEIRKTSPAYILHTNQD